MITAPIRAAVSGFSDNGEWFTPHIVHEDEFVVLSADEVDISRGYMRGPDGRAFALSPKHREGYKIGYRPTYD
jgi:hypothetical protein